MKDLRELNSHRILKRELDHLNKDFEHMGVFKFEINGTTYTAIATDDHGWDHVSISSYYKMPSWDIMESLKNKFFKDDEFAVEFHPKREDYVNNHAKCLHLWRPQETTLPYPDIQQIKKSKPQILSKKVIQIDSVPYCCTHSLSDDFEFITVESGFSKRPSWEAMCKIKQEYFGDTVALSYHGKRGDQLSKLSKNHTDSLMIFRPTKELVKTPPSWLVGDKNLSPEESKSIIDTDLMIRGYREM